MDFMFSSSATSPVRCKFLSRLGHPKMHISLLARRETGMSVFVL